MRRVDDIDRTCLHGGVARERRDDECRGEGRGSPFRVRDERGDCDEVRADAHHVVGLEGYLRCTLYAKSYFGTPVEESQIQRILKNCDFVVAGIGD